MIREPFVRKKKVYKKNPEPFEWEHGTYMGGSALRIFPANVFEFWAGLAARQK